MIERQSIGGIGIYITDVILDKLGFEGDYWEDEANFLEDIENDKVIFKEYGYRGYTGNKEDGGFIALVPGDTYKEMRDNIFMFKQFFETRGVNVSTNDLLVVSEVYVS